MKLFLSPHNDDETLFGAFTIMREKPLVVVVFDSYIQVARGAEWCDWKTRRQETARAMIALGQFSHYALDRDELPDDRLIESAQEMDYREELEGVMRLPLRFCGLRDDCLWTGNDTFKAICETVGPEHLSGVIAPADEPNGHAHHNLVAVAAASLAGNLEIPLVKYTTYTRTGGKTRTETPVPIENPEWIERKLRALACYKSQIRHPQCQEHFLRSQEEYYL